MKNLFYLAITALLISCGQDVPTTTYEGNFLATPDAAVLAVGDEMYAVTMDDMAKELATKVKASQNEVHDMVPVVIEALVTPKPANTQGWDSIITIKKIVSVSPDAVAPDIKIEETEQ